MFKCKYSELVALHKLVPHPNNPNKHPDEQIERLAKIIDFQGWRHPIIVSNLSKFIVAGHARLSAAKKLGIDEVPVDYQDFESEAQEYAFLVSDNAIAEFYSETDLSFVNKQLPDLGEDFDLELLGIKQFTIDADFDPVSEDEQGKLDENKLIFMECPNCNEKFEKSQAKVIN